MKAADFVTIASLVAMGGLSPAEAAGRIRVDLPAATLGIAVARLGAGAGVAIGISDPDVAALPTRALHGRFGVDAALRRLVAGLPARAERIDAQSWRVVERMPPPTSGRRVAATAPAGSIGDIIVTGSKTGVRLDSYAGTATAISGEALASAAAAAGSDALVRKLASLNSTNLGPGRDKLFIRGVADSSFNGSSQAVVGQYLGDVRLNYNAPDPDISLYDVDRVEVLEGPQGTLYGAGALGGVVRIIPRPADMAATTGQMSLDRSFTSGGADGFDIAGMLNLPIVPERLALRAVVFDTIDGGYIDVAGRDRRNVNRTHRRGGRIALEERAGDWRVVLGAAAQNIDSRDGQYAELGQPRLTRSDHVAQPFDNDYLLGSLTLSREWGATSFLSASAIVRQRMSSQFDFTPAPAAVPRVFDERNRINLLSNETRIARRDKDGRGWVLGFSVLHDDERITRSLGDPAAPEPILGVRNDVTEAALFGEAGLELLPKLVGTLGGRIDYSHLTGAPLDRAAAVDDPRRSEVGFLPSASLSYRPGDAWLLFARYQEGLRPGGLAVSTVGDTAVAQRFREDSLAAWEGGLRWSPARDQTVRVSFSVSYAHWGNIQADLIDDGGFPITRNIGSGTLRGAEAEVRWQPSSAITLTAAVFGNDSQLTKPAPGITQDDDQELPNVAHLGAAVLASTTRQVAAGWRLEIEGGLRYVGHSRLGTRPDLYIRQGNYLITNASARLGSGRFGVTLQVDNLLDEARNTFAFGNPYDVSAGRQMVPLRPRTLRIGIDAGF